MAKSFSRFTSLPPEIRLMVWESHLSLQLVEENGPVITLDKIFNQQLERFRKHGEPIYAQTDMPAAFSVSHEARRAATAWAKKNDLLHFCRKTQRHAYIRNWTTGSLRPALYVPPGESHWDIDDALQMYAYFSLDDDIIKEYWSHVIFPAETAYYDYEMIQSFIGFMRPKTISFLWGRLPDYRYTQFSLGNEDDHRGPTSARREIKVQSALKLEKVDPVQGQCFEMVHTGEYETTEEFPLIEMFDSVQITEKFWQDLYKHPTVTIPDIPLSHVRVAED